MFGRRGVAVALSSLALVGSSLVWAPAGQAHESEHVLCAGSSTSMYDPPLTLQPRPTRVRTHAGYECTAKPGRTVQATGYLEGVSPSASCITVDSPHLKEFVHYADGERSLIAYDSGTTVRVAGVLVVRLSGRVIKGRGEGQAAQRIVPALPGQLPTECLSSGLRGSGGEAVLEIGL
ncbi:hypothetical protein AQI88_39455 [Streptomyces cellostaticus]|uniref:Uncharacterized protein n=1 Tax=Streptomyces cellostaticus TaxID=67285 RepID=A0A101NAR4_9ACTN|nr:hypothetical protein [Streptomyces cellostaticus]KUM89740.1 hypothetical protein AQI88_39455 [Streptomyces cellostaticus]GHI10231.1 hypothetical protein Scel_85520 [Streptomyces cellostaticus]